MAPIADFQPILRQAIRLAREAGLAESAADLEERSTATFTTSSEWLGEMGEAILRFRANEGERVPGEVEDLLDLCLREIGKTWPGYRPGLFNAILRRAGRAWRR